MKKLLYPGRALLKSEPAPVTMFVVIVAVVFVAEVLVMLLLNALPSIPIGRAVFLDALLLILLIFPVLYFYFLRPVQAQIAERRQAEREAWEVKEFLERIFSLTHILIAYMDTDFNFIRVNRAYAEADERDPEFYTGKNHFDLFPHAENQAIFQNVVKTGEPYFVFDKAFSYAEHPERGVSYWDWTLFPVKDERDKVTGVILSLVNVTMRKQAQDALIESELRFQAAFDQTFQFMCLLTPDGTIVQVNRSALEYWGVTHEEIAGRSLWEAMDEMVRPDMQARLLESIASSAEGKLVQMESEIVSPSGQHMNIDVSIKPVLNEAGQVAFLIVEGRDITIHVQAQAEVRKAHDDLAAINQELHAEIAERKRIEARLHQNMQRAVAISTIMGFAQDVSLDYRNLLENTAQSTAETLGDACHISLIADNGDLQLYSAFHQVHHGTGEVYGTSSPPAHLLDYLQEIERRAMRSRKPLILPRPAAGAYEATPNFDPPMAELAPKPLHGLMAVPMIAQGKLLGVMSLVRDHTSAAYTGEDYDFVQNVVARTSLVVYNVQLYRAEQRARQVAEILSDTSQTLTQSLDLDVILNTLLDHLQHLVPHDGASVYLLENEHLLVSRHVRGNNRESVVGSTRVELQANPLLRELLESHKPIWISDLQKQRDWEIALCNGESGSWLGIALLAGEKAIGLCALQKETPGFYSAEDAYLAEAIVSLAAVALQNAWLFEQVLAGRERLQSLARRLVEVQENERRYIARELHDEVAQALASLVVGLHVIKRDAFLPEAVIGGVADLQRILDGVLEELHRLAINLRPASLDHLGLVSAIRQHAEGISDKHHLLVQFEAVGVASRLPSDIETALYRIVQEALTNVVRHAQASRVDVLLEQRSSNLILMVEDNGIGFDVESLEQTGRLGLFGVRERAEMLGGELHLESVPGSGTTILVEVPYDPENHHR